MHINILDYGQPNPFGGTIGKRRNLAWPVESFRITLPQPADDGEKMNLFERVFLKLIDTGGTRNVEMLAQETCLPQDLVQCVILRLQDQGYLDEANQIIKQKRDRWAGDNQNQPEFVTACIFRELVTGKILPYLHVLKDNPLKRKGEEKKFVYKIRWDEEHRANPPAGSDVISALRRMHRRSIAYGKACYLPSVQLITIVEDAELYYLDCPIAIQKSDSEFRIADPFGNGFSLVLENAFRYLLETDGSLSEWLKKWKTDLSNRGYESKAPSPQEPYDSDANWTRYPKLLSNLRLKARRFRSVENIHASLEWALFYSCAQRPYASVIEQLKLTSQSEHPALLQKAAQDLSLLLPPGRLLAVREGKLNDFLAGKAEFGTVLSLSLLMAADDALHPLRRVASAYQNFIERLLQIKKERDEAGHGGKARLQDIELPEEAFMKEVITALLPEIRFQDVSGTLSDAEKEAVADELLDARTSIQSEFEFALFNHLEMNLQERLIHAERFWLSVSCNESNEKHDSLAFACDLYATLQMAFRKSLSNALPPDIAESEYIARARENAMTCGLGDLPKCIITAKKSAIRETLLGNDQTLQSCVVAFLLVSPGDTLDAVAQVHPSFINDVTSVIESRGHGNESLPLSKDEIFKLRKAAYTTIKTLLEV